MFDFVPINDYTLYYYQFYLIVILFIFINSNLHELNNKKNIGVLNLLGYSSLFFTIFYMGLRPINGVFIDMTMYAYMFERFQDNDPVIIYDDYGFYYFLEFCSKIMTVEFFFFICVLLYVLPLYFFSKRNFKKYWAYSFIMFCISFSFWAYGTNGIRNGIATSFFILGLAHRKNKYLSFGLMLFACTFHQTLLLPTIAYLLSNFYKSTKVYLLIWTLTIPISIVLGNYFVNLIEVSGFGSEKIGAYFTDDVNDEFVGSGFRWDFLVYSATAVIIGWFYIFKRNFNDVFYKHIFNTYLICNVFWILIIKVNFSNRFAYLSWFLMAIIFIYPLLKDKIFKFQNARIGLLVFLYFIFTYLMNVILIK